VSETIVLVHGAYHGGWCWRKVAPRLRQLGHQVFTPTFSGLGERAHLLGPEIGLNSMIQDVVALIETEDIDDVVLVGHSFGCLPVLGVADRVPERIRRLVLLDGLVVAPWQRAGDNLPPAELARRMADAWRHHRGLAISPPPASEFGVVDPTDVAWLERRMTPQPVKGYLEPFVVQNPLGNGLPVTYVCCTAPKYTPCEPSHPHVREAGFEWREVAAPHDLMITHPELTVDEVLR
jgi:pimeloyl-ACP methyl ester carboxylesterase